jgi:hypothetical protein
MYRVRCKGCGASGITDNGHQLQAAVSCRCCTQDHDHQQAADSCPGVRAAAEAGGDLSQQHAGADCGHPSGDGTSCTVLTPQGSDCPGGHCGPGVDGCTVCRPLDVDYLGSLPMSFTGVN